MQEIQAARELFWFVLEGRVYCVCVYICQISTAERVSLYPPPHTYSSCFLKLSSEETTQIKSIKVNYSIYLWKQKFNFQAEFLLSCMVMAPSYLYPQTKGWIKNRLTGPVQFPMPASVPGTCEDFSNYRSGKLRWNKGHTAQ